jgi:hypothetical protein
LPGKTEESELSPQCAPLFGCGPFPDPPEPSDTASLAEPPKLTIIVHHAQGVPNEHLCACGKVRETCVHDEVRALWQLVSEPGPAVPPKA